MIQPPLHMRLRGRIDQTTERLALRATLAASHLLGLATGNHLRALRAHTDPLLRLQSRVEEAEIKARASIEVAEILAFRFGKIPERHRPHFSPAHRFRILEVRSLLGWNVKDTARRLLVCPNTILNWERSADPESRAVGSMVRPTPPVRRAADVVRALVQTMARLGFGGQDLVARTLVRAGWRVSARSVARYRRERPVALEIPEEAPPQRPLRPVSTRFVHHTWMMDITQIKQFLGPDLHMAAVFEAHSRVPLAIRVFESAPRAREMFALLLRAVKRSRRPRYLITDLGPQFVAGAFKTAVKRLGILQRFACADNIRATARLERFWRTVKQTARLRGLQLALTVDDLERRLEVALVHYLCFRPHEGLGGATPLEVFVGIEPAHLKAVESPRGRPGEKKGNGPFRAVFLDHPGARFPVLTPAG